MKHKFFRSLLLALVPLCLLAQVPVTRNSTKPKAKPKTEQTAKPAKPSATKRTNSSGATSSSAANAKLTLNNLTANMVYVSGGTFTMGATSEQGSEADNDEKPVYSVTLSSFYICKYEVTQALWKAVMGSNPSKWKGDDLPVECVSWDDCQTFIRKLNALTGKNFRLPTEAEWEFAARGGNNSRGYKYAGSNNIGDVAWYDDNSGSKTHVVGTKSPNELGLYDMSGNVYEWCQDRYGSYSSASQTNPTGASSGSGRVLRGGSWYDFASNCPSSYCYYSMPDLRHDFGGLRLVLSQPSATKRTNSSGATSNSSLQSISSKTFTVNGVSFDMMYVKGGTFIMGATSEQGSDADSYEKPTHRVTLSNFYIGKYEVTQALWKAVMGSSPSNRKGDDLPVEWVSWNDCQNFIRKLNALTGKNFRLPTEAEWEFAARGGNHSCGYKYVGSNNIDTVAWYNGNSGGKTHAVGTKSPNELGLYDMSGNVWEWCHDRYGSYSSASQTNPTGASSGSGRVVRGGSWAYIAGYCRSSYRYNYTPDGRYSDSGLRLVLSQL